MGNYGGFGAVDDSTLYRRLATSLATTSFTAFVKPPYPLFLFRLSAIGPSNLVVFSSLVSQISPQLREVYKTLPILMSCQVNQQLDIALSQS
jgi:hypothetical protein